jgi:hypothetical protein
VVRFSSPMTNGRATTALPSTDQRVAAMPSLVRRTPAGTPLSLREREREKGCGSGAGRDSSVPGCSQSPSGEGRRRQIVGVERRTESRNNSISPTAYGRWCWPAVRRGLAGSSAPCSSVLVDAGCAGTLDIAWTVRYYTKLPTYNIRGSRIRCGCWMHRTSACANIDLPPGLYTLYSALRFCMLHSPRCAKFIRRT